MMGGVGRNGGSGVCVEEEGDEWATMSTRMTLVREEEVEKQEVEIKVFLSRHFFWLLLILSGKLLLRFRDQ